MLGKREVRGEFSNLFPLLLAQGTFITEMCSTKGDGQSFWASEINHQDSQGNRYRICVCPLFLPKEGDTASGPWGANLCNEVIS